MKLFEITGDDKFDSFMDRMGKEAREKKSASDKLHRDISKLAKDIPGMIQAQREQEQWANAEIQKLHKFPDEMLRLRANKMLRPVIEMWPNADTLLYGVVCASGTDKNPSNPFRRSFDDDHEKELNRIADEYIETHREDLRDALIAWEKRMNEFCKAADSMNWVIPWRNHNCTTWGHFKGVYNSIKGDLKAWKITT